MRNITIYYPKKVDFGIGAVNQLAGDVVAAGIKRLFIISVDVVINNLKTILHDLSEQGVEIEIETDLPGEPTYSDFYRVLKKAQEFGADCIAGIGGGSVMDLAKIVAALLKSDQKLDDVIGIRLLTGRNTSLICIPTTSGTGSEMSPNSILLDEKDNAKKGIISPYLVPDLVYIDPELTFNLPPAITAFTGIDALTHCIEAYCNKNAHPVIDQYALKGIQLICSSLLKAVKNGDDIQARTDLALGSMYGGMCLGPVNTAAVHALAYPLGSDYHIPHGLSNALLLPYVMEFNLDADYKRYADVAKTIGITDGSPDQETAEKGIRYLKSLLTECGVPQSLKDVGVKKETLESMAKDALNVKRLLVNNLKEIDFDAALNIYSNAYNE